VITRFGFVAALTLLPLAALADISADAQKLQGAWEEAGCNFTVQNGAAIAEAAGLDQNSLLQAVNELYTQGLVTAEADGSMKLQTEACK
jgi:hypothetical protein